VQPQVQVREWATNRDRAQVIKKHLLRSKTNKVMAATGSHQVQAAHEEESESEPSQSLPLNLLANSSGVLENQMMAALARNPGNSARNWPGQ